MAQLPAGRKSKKYDFLGGGLVTRPDDRYVNLLNEQGHFYSPNETNVQFTKIASIQKRLGYSQVGSDIQNCLWYSNVPSGGLSTLGAPVALVDNVTVATCFKITASSSASIVSVICSLVTIGANYDLARKNMKNIRCVIKSNSGGNPGTTLGASNALDDGLEVTSNSGTLRYTTLYFPAPVALTNGVDYWFCFEGVATHSAPSYPQDYAVLGVIGDASSGSFKTTKDSYATFSSGTGNTFISVYSTVAPVLGIYDYRPQAAGVVTQFPIIACHGSLYYYNSGYTSIASGLASTANKLYDFSTLKNYLFSCDYATNNNQCWDGAAAATMTHGYRQSTTGSNNISLAQSASAGGPWSAAGIVQVMLVTQLVSGGYRCSQPKSITLAGTTNKIDITSIAVNSTAAQFSFDVSTLATTIYCTLPNGAIYYKVPAAYTSGTANPIANATTSQSILPMTDAQLQAGGSFETNLAYPQGYATGQVDTPKAKFFEVFQNMLASAGDPNYPSRVWFSEQFAPQVWGDGSSGTGIQGDYLDIAVSDGETITGIAVSDGALMVGKQSGIYRVDYTGNASNSWNVNKIHGQVGVLSNWSMQVIPDGLFFLSNRGPAICFGSYSDVLPQTRLIQNLFDNTSATSFNLDSMIYTVACNDTTRNQIMMTVSSPGVSIRDRILSYDYEQKMFTLYDGYQANYLAIIGDSNGFPVLWTGNLSGQAFKRSSAYFDNNSNIIVVFDTPNIDFGDPSSWAQVDFLHVSGKVQTSGYFYVDFYANDSTTAYKTVQIDMTSALFASGMAVRIGTVCKAFKMRFRNVDFTGVSGFELHWLRLEWSESGGTRLG